MSYVVVAAVALAVAVLAMNKAARRSIFVVFIAGALVGGAIGYSVSSSTSAPAPAAAVTKAP